jgi:hypothetical protein
MRGDDGLMAIDTARIVTVRLPGTLHARLKRRAQLEDRSLANLILTLVRQAMEGWADPKDDRA